MESAGAAGQEEDLYRDGRVAFYAKGMIKGEWLLTAAYDSTRPPDGRKSMYQTVDPNKYYLLYGDAAEQLHDAASAKHIYIKLERDQFYALFGDYHDGTDRDRAVPLQPQPDRLQVRVQGRPLRVQPVRGRHRPGPSPGRTAGRRHLGPLPPVAQEHRDEFRAGDDRGARPVQKRGDRETAGC